MPPRRARIGWRTSSKHVFFSLCPPLVCLAVCLSFCLSVCLSACLSFFPFAFLPACLPVCLPVCLSVCLVCLSCLPACLSAWLSVYLSSCLCVCRCVCLPGCLPGFRYAVYLPVFLSAGLPTCLACLPVCLPAGLPVSFVRLYCLSSRLSTPVCVPTRPFACPPRLDASLLLSARLFCVPIRVCPPISRRVYGVSFVYSYIRLSVCMHVCICHHSVCLSALSACLSHRPSHTRAACTASLASSSRLDFIYPILIFKISRAHLPPPVLNERRLLRTACDCRSSRCWLVLPAIIS